jgi:tyrosyl-tRNA synthetase
LLPRALKAATKEVLRDCYHLLVEKTAREVFAAAGTRFGFADPEGKIPTTSKAAAPVSAEVELPVTEIDAAEFGENGITVPRLLVLTGICKSTSDGRRLIQGGAVSIDDNKVSDISLKVTLADIKNGSFTIRSGKKNFRKVIVG